MRSKQIDPNLSIFLNICRALAAMLVLAGHLRGGLFNSFDQLGIEHQHIVNYVLFFITRIGHECVIVFFVLSGYLVGGNILIDTINKNQDWKKYFIDRLARMWMVLLPALLIGYFLDLYRCEYLNDCFQVTQFNFKTVFGNVFFLQTVYVPFFTSNVALWSLANEFWYYLIFPVFLIPFRVKQFKYLSIIIIISVLFIAYMVMPHIIQLFPLWLLGVGVRLFSIPKQFKHWAFIPFIYIALLITVFYSNTSESIFGNYLVALFFSLVILFHKENPIISFQRFKKLSDFFSDFSFSLYAIHLPVLFFLMALFHKYTPFYSRLNNAGIFEWGIYLGFMILILLISYFFYLLFEKQTHKLRKWVYSKI